MTRRGIVPFALVACAVSLAIVFTARTQAQQNRPRHESQVVRTPGGAIGMTGPNAPRAGSVQRHNTPDYQQASFDPTAQASAPIEAETSATIRGSRPKSRSAKRSAVRRAVAREDYFDPRLNHAPSAQARTTIDRAAYQELDLAGNTIAAADGVAPIAAPEDLPLPGPMESIVPADTMPHGPMQYRGGPLELGSPISGDCACGQGDCGGACGGTCGDGCGGCGMCDTCPDWYPGKDLTLFAGVHAFSSASDAAGGGSFGFHEGVNWSSPFWNAAGVGFQLGFQAMQSDFREGDFFDNDRSQYFITTGFFRRQMCERGWQWGVVYDFLSDEFADEFDVSQIRGELSYLFRGHELGFWFASAVGDDQPGEDSASGFTTFETLDMYTFFYRRRLARGGEGRLWGGFTGDSDGIFGGDVRVPLACDWDLVAAFNYLSPGDQTAEDQQFSEAWNIGINLVWYVCPEGAFKAAGSRYRPLFNVADNGTLVVKGIQ